MRKTKQNFAKFFLISILLFAALLTINIFSKKTPKINNNLHVVFDNVSYREFSESGGINKTITAALLHKNNDNYKAEDISAKVVENNNKQELMAKHGSSGDIKNTIKFSHGVVISEKINNGETTLKTNNITVNLEKKIAFTKAQTELIRENGTVNSKGVEIDLISKTFKMLKSISGSFLPSSIKK